MNPTHAANQPGAQPADRVQIKGVWFDRVTMAQAIERVLTDLSAGKGGWVVTPNLDILRQATRDPDLRALIGAADLSVADGMPIIWASRLQGCPLPERVAGSSLIEPLSAEAGERGARVFLLGGNPGVAEQAAALLEQRCPGLVIAGTDCPPLGFEQAEGYIDGLRDKIVNACPDLIYVALGAPKQERLIRELRSAAPNAWWLGVGISLSFLTGEVRRAPLWMQRLGLEWLHRLVQEPRRLAKRYLVDGLPFAIALLVGGVLGRLKARKNSPGPCL